jgi:hypothetical protein
LLGWASVVEVAEPIQAAERARDSQNCGNIQAARGRGNLLPEKRRSSTGHDLTNS